jgi:hypothetical protein
MWEQLVQNDRAQSLSIRPTSSSSEQGASGSDGGLGAVVMIPRLVHRHAMAVTEVLAAYTPRDANRLGASL